jgi:hypothetical protein
MVGSAFSRSDMKPGRGTGSRLLVAPFGGVGATTFRRLRWSLTTLAANRRTTHSRPLAALRQTNVSGMNAYKASVSGLCSDSTEEP